MELSKEEQEAIDLFKEILDERSCLISDDIGENDIKVVLNLIQKQSKVIDEMANTIVGDRRLLHLMCDRVINKTEDKCYEDNVLCDDCIKQYFYRKAEEV